MKTKRFKKIDATKNAMAETGLITHHGAAPSRTGVWHRICYIINIDEFR